VEGGLSKTPVLGTHTADDCVGDAWLQSPQARRCHQDWILERPGRVRGQPVAAYEVPAHSMCDLSTAAETNDLVDD
jgi:hypothetical protein